MSNLSELFRMHRGIPGLRQSWKFKDFQWDLHKGFGFDGAMQAAGGRDGYLALDAPLVRRRRTTAVSFVVLFSVLRYLPGLWQEEFKGIAPADPRHLQLMELESGVTANGGWHSAPLGGVTSPVFTGWIGDIRRRDSRLKEVEEAMRRVWNVVGEFRVRKQHGVYNPDFVAYVGENGCFQLRCPGNACDLSTVEWWERAQGDGHRLDCHNLDTSSQQLTLLAGLAKMHDLAGQDIDSRPLP